MNEEKIERIYQTGQRFVWTQLLRQALRGLGYKIGDTGGVEELRAELARHIVEREEAIAQLRSVCEEVGDNDWEENLHLADIIEKHLGNYVIE